MVDVVVVVVVVVVPAPPEGREMNNEPKHVDASRCPLKRREPR